MKHKRLLVGILTGVLILFLVLLAAGYFMVDYALKPGELTTRSRNISGSWEQVRHDYPELGPWLDSLRTVDALKETYIENERGERLHAFYVPAARPTRRTALIIHGYTDNAIRMMPIGYLYSRQLGYNILLPDLHAHGLSEGDAVQMGWLDRLDIQRWANEARQLFGDSIRTVVHGISMGAATTMMFSGDVEQMNVQPPQCFVEDCGYTSVWDEFKGELKNRFGLPAFPLLDIASLFCQWRYGWNFREASALEQVRQCTQPMLFIHGDADTFVPTWMVHPLYEAKPGPKELWLVPGAEHAVSYKENKEEYTRRVRNFVDRYIR